MNPADAGAPLVAVVDGAPAIIALLEEALTLEGLRVVGMPLSGRTSLEADLVAFLRRHAPQIVLLDIPPPYAASWPLVQAARRGAPNSPIIVLTTDPYAVAEFTENDEEIEVIGKPFELEDVLAAVRQRLPASRDEPAARAT